MFVVSVKLGPHPPPPPGEKQNFKGLGGGGGALAGIVTDYNIHTVQC